MIQIQDKNVENQVYFPKSTNIEGDLVLKLHSELTQKDYTFDVVNMSKTSNYYKFNVNFKSVENGEYTYFINDTDSGLIRIGNVDEAVSTSTYIDGIEVVQYYPQDVKETDYSKEPLTFKILSYGTINWTTSDSSLTKTIEYKLNDGEWTHITSNTEGAKITVNSGNKIQFRGNNATYCDGSAINTFGSSTAEFEVEGNIMSLIDSTNFKNNSTISSTYAFYGLFEGCTKLISAENLVLPATTLAGDCYNSMFRGCTSLTTAPVLPATTLASSCYVSMFNGCTSLTTAPVLPATTLANYCYYYMFQGCTSLTTAPELPATTLAPWCYDSMFYGTNVLPDCSNIDFASSTVVASGGLQGLFSGTKVTDNDLERLLPKNDNGRYYLPATTLADRCYQNMFYNCTSLTTAPALPATTLANNCYSYMFRGCTSLTTAPALPAIDLKNYCYQNMFYGCKSLTTAPALPATTLASNCYQNMFYNCIKLNYIKMLATNISASNCLKNWVNGVSSTGTFVKNAAMTSLPTGASGIPSGWTVNSVVPGIPGASGGAGN